MKIRLALLEIHAMVLGTPLARLLDGTHYEESMNRHQLLLLRDRIVYCLRVVEDRIKQAYECEDAIPDEDVRVDEPEPEVPGWVDSSILIPRTAADFAEVDWLEEHVTMPTVRGVKWPNL